MPSIVRRLAAVWRLRCSAIKSLIAWDSLNVPTREAQGLRGGRLWCLRGKLRGCVGFA